MDIEDKCHVQQDAKEGPEIQRGQRFFDYRVPPGPIERRTAKGRSKSLIMQRITKSWLATRSYSEGAAEYTEPSVAYMTSSVLSNLRLVDSKPFSPDTWKTPCPFMPQRYDLHDCSLSIHKIFHILLLIIANRLIQHMENHTRPLMTTHAQIMSE